MPYKKQIGGKHGKNVFSRVDSSFYSFYIQLLPINLVSIINYEV